MNKKILVVAAHPDDEILGLGATLVKHVEERDQVYCLILGGGVVSRDRFSQDDIKKLQKQTANSSKIIGFKAVYSADFPDNSFDSVSLLQIIKLVESYIKKIKPDVVYTHFENDLNIDHRLTFQAVLTACRPVNNNFPEKILTFETLSSTEWQNKQGLQFNPNYYVDVKKYIDKKIEAMKKYSLETRSYPHPRSAQGIKILAQYRGLESGLEYAEAFCLIRKIIK